MFGVEGLGFFRWHLEVFDETGDVMNERAARAVAFDDVDAVFAASQRGFARIETVAALGTFGAVAADATVVEYRTDIAIKIDLRGGGGRKFGF